MATCDCKESEIPIWLILSVFTALILIFCRAFVNLAADRPRVHMKSFTINKNTALAISAFLAIPSFLILFPKLSIVSHAQKVPHRQWAWDGSTVNQYDFNLADDNVVLFNEPTCSGTFKNFVPQVLPTQRRENKNLFWYDAGPIVLCPLPSCSGWIGACALQNKEGFCAIQEDCDVLFSVQETKKKFI
jgi:hypothetical protein